MSTLMETGSRTGWLYNYHPTTETPKDRDGTVEGEGVGRAALVLLFQDHSGDMFHAHLHYNPYLFVLAADGHEREVELGLMSMFGPQLIQQITLTEKEDTSLVNHLSGRKRTLLKVVFNNVADLSAVRLGLEKMVKRNESITGADGALWGQFCGSLTDAMNRNFQDDPMHSANQAGANMRWMDWVQEVREYDVKYHMRVAIDLKIFCGLWYDVDISDGEANVVRCDDSKFAPAMPRVVAFDIETSKAPLRFPQPETDQIYMISYMLDGRGYLIVNREIVTENINPFEYTPKPEFEGFFDTFNEVDEAGTLRRFFDEMKKYKPNVYVTYNGDYFDFPFIHARALFHGMNMRKEIGFSQAHDGAFLNPQVPHLDCFYWVKRDSYLPQGSQGLKAVTKNKLGYDPIEVDPEEMMPLAQEQPQKMAAYSVSDAVSTWYLYERYVHPFIFSLATIIPMSPDDVLRKGSGGLCESLLMVQAEANNVVFPNKKETELERFYDGHLIDTETYIGGRVEALRSGVYRSDLPLAFNMVPDAYQGLIDDLDEALRFTVENENGLKLEEVTNLAEVKQEILSKLELLRDNPKQQEMPLIYHLDVGAMYPNIILTNRLQPYAIPTPDMCAGCCFNTPNNEHQCKRPMEWKWRGELFTANRSEFQRVKAQLENESFAAGVIEQANLAAVQKKAYGQRKGNVLEGTTYEKKDNWQRDRDKRGGSGAGNGYRKESKHQQREASDALISTTAPSKRGGNNNHGGGGGSSDDDSDDEGGLKAYHKLNESTQFNMLKRRLTEYSRKAYGKIHETREITRTNVVCQRENSFYVDTVRLFRDRRYEYKVALKNWKTRLDAATDPDERKLCQSRCVQMESLQLAHKCILNSFYGYVMRKGSRWSSIEMAGIVTYLGASLIQLARALVQQIGVTLELDTDGIWCCLPSTFPENFTLTTSNPKKAKVKVSYPCVVLNKMVADRYSNTQYQDLVSPGLYKAHSECSIYFEVDGPYRGMLLPASREEGKGIKKRYAVFDMDGGLAELKGFELKRRGELMLIKDFQSQVFRRFLDGSTLAEAYLSAAVVANVALDLLESKGAGYEMEEILEKITESSNMSRKLAEYPKERKSLAITTARRIAEFLGPQMVKDKGLACQFIISRLPADTKVTERAIPIVIFRADPTLRTHFLRKWTSDNMLTADLDFTSLVDWDYYTGRFNACVQKIITIPAALQSIANPVPRVHHPDWLSKLIRQQNSRYRQVSLTGMFTKMNKEQTEARAAAAAANEEGDEAGPHGELQDMEDLFGGAGNKRGAASSMRRAVEKNKAGAEGGDSDWEDEKDDRGALSDDDGVADETERILREREEEAEGQVQAVRRAYFGSKSTKQLDPQFFAAPGTATWLVKQRQTWLHRSKLRKEMAASLPDSLGHDGGELVASDLLSASTQGGSHFIDLKSRALSSNWQVLEVRDAPEELGAVTAVVALGSSVHLLRVLVPRRVIVDVAPDGCDETVRRLHEGSLEVANRILPRNQAAGRLFQVDVPPGVDGDRCLNELSITEGVRKIYESNISRVDSFIESVGCCASVRSQAHLLNSRRRPPAQRECFHTEEMDSTSTTGYLAKVAGRCAFVFHVSADTRGVVALVDEQTHTATVVFVQPAAAAKPSINWAPLREEAARLLNVSAQSGADALKVVTEVAPDLQTSWRLINQRLAEAIDAGRPPLVVVLESTLPTAQLVQQRSLPAALPYLRTLGAHEDEKLFADPFRWARLLAQRLLQRYYASTLWVEERLAMSRVSGIPICNVAQDSCVHVLDVLYSRALHRRSHVLWDSCDPEIAFDTVEEQPREVAMPGGYTNWCVEFSLSRLDVVAVLFSQMIQEGDDPNAHVLCDRGVSSHFNLLRDMIADVFSQAVDSDVAGALLGNVSRWIRDPVSTCYDPRMVELLSGLAHRALTMVLLRLAKLGGRTVKVDSTSVVVLTTKHSLNDVKSFATFVTGSLQDQPMLTLLSLQPVRYWCPYIVLDKRDYAGLYILADDALRLLDGQEPELGQLAMEQQLNFCSRLPHNLKRLLAHRVGLVLQRMAVISAQVLAQIAKDPTVTLATRVEEVQKRLLKCLQRYFEDELQPDLMDELTGIMESRDVYTDDERAAAAETASERGLANASSLLQSSSAVALEYTKCVGRVLDHIPSNDAVSKVRNNCLRLCSVSPFSPQANLDPDPLANVRMLDITCSFCNTPVYIDLCHKARAAANVKGGRAFQCLECESPIAAEAVEAHLVRVVNRTVMNAVQQDFVCSRCKEMASTFMCNNCCGPLVGKAKSAQSDLLALRFIAQFQAFAWLAEAVDVALMAI